MVPSDMVPSHRIIGASVPKEGQKIRFLTSAEKKTILGKRSRFEEREEGDPNAFISVLIDGNTLQVGLFKHSLQVNRELMLFNMLVSGRVCEQGPRGRR